MEVAGSPGPGAGDPPERRGQCPAFGTWGEATMTVAIIATMRDLASVPAGRTASRVRDLVAGPRPVVVTSDDRNYTV